MPRMKKPIEEKTSGLPKIDVPVYELKIPSTGTMIKVRPFSVKEEKLLLMAVESNDMPEIINTTMQIINNCIVDGDVNIDKLPFFDIDYIFIFLRAKSIGESIDVKLECRNLVNEKPCGNIVPSQMNIANCDLYIPDNLSDDIKLDKNKGVKMKYPTYASVKRLDDDKGNLDKKLTLIVNSIDYIYDAATRYYSKDFSKDELKKFVEDLTEENFKKLEYFVDNFPTFYVTLKAKCSKCQFDHEVRYTDFYDFFS